MPTPRRACSRALGVRAERLILENKSRNTYENAVFTKELVDAEARRDLAAGDLGLPHAALGRRCSARPAFRSIPWPVDYRTSGKEGIGLFRDNAAGFAAEHDHGDPRMDRPCRLLAVGPDRSVFPGP